MQEDITRARIVKLHLHFELRGKYSEVKIIRPTYVSRSLLLRIKREQRIRSGTNETQ